MENMYFNWIQIHEFDFASPLKKSLRTPPPEPKGNQWDAIGGRRKLLSDEYKHR